MSTAFNRLVFGRLGGLMLAAALALGACAGGPSTAAGKPGAPTLVVTYSALGAIVRDLVGDAATVVVLVPNGADPHEWEPSARDIETVMKSSLLVENGLGLEGGLATTFGQAEKAGVRRFVAADHVTVRIVAAGQGANPTDADQAAGARDPHLWLDPQALRAVVEALAAQLKSDLGLDLGTRAADLEARLSALDGEVAAVIGAIPADHRKLVTGHESLGYFADRYGLTLIGAIVPSLTTGAAPSASSLAALAATIRAAGVPAIFTELGTSPDVAAAIGRETGARVVEITTHAMPADGSYFTFLKNLATVIADNLR